jgi:hypothetical protein
MGKRSNPSWRKFTSISDFLQSIAVQGSPLRLNPKVARSRGAAANVAQPKFRLGNCLDGKVYRATSSYRYEYFAAQNEILK